MRFKASFAATLSALMLAVVGVMPAAAQTNPASDGVFSSVTGAWQAKFSQT
jgi:hypothetical protein